jgi:hypothetical protein
MRRCASEHAGTKVAGGSGPQLGQVIAASVHLQFGHFPKTFFLQEFVQMDISNTDSWHVRPSLPEE